MEQKPHKKDELMVANSVLRLAEELLKVCILLGVLLCALFIAGVTLSYRLVITRE